MHAPQRLLENRQARHRLTPTPRRATPAWIALATAALLGGAAFAQAMNPTVQVRYDAKLGYYLTDASGMTLYVFAKDAKNQSNCNGGCAKAWPPLLADSASAAPLDLGGSFSVVTRADGTKQVAYEGRPLYTFKGDKKPGDAAGQGFRNAWWVANLQPAVQLLETASGSILVGPTGMTLYTFAKDGTDTSACSAKCATNWPPAVGGYDPAHGDMPLAGAGVKGTLGVMKRADGSMQLTLNGKPLYYFRGDRAPGQATGNGLFGLWEDVAQN